MGGLCISFSGCLAIEASAQVVAAAQLSIWSPQNTHDKLGEWFSQCRPLTSEGFGKEAN